MCAHSRPVQDCQSSEVTEPPALKASTGCRELTPHPHPTVTCGGVSSHFIFELMNTAIGVSLNMGHSTVNNRIHEVSFAEF